VVGEDSSGTDRCVESARGEALVLLSRRPLSERELRDGLLERGHAAAVVEAVIEALRRVGHVDDRRLALHYVQTRSARLGHGPRRLIGALVRRGVDEACARAAWDAAVRDGDVDPVELIRRQLRRRVGPTGQLDRAGYRRVYNALLRAGFTTEEVREELASLRHGLDHEVSDDFA